MMRWILLVLLLLAWPFTAWSANKIQITEDGATVTFADLAQTPTVKLTFANIAPGTARVSAVWDRGAGPRTDLLRVECSLQLTGSLDTTEGMELWFATSRDNTVIDGPVTADSTILGTSRALVNALRPAGVFLVSQTTTNTSMVYSGLVEGIPERYLYLIVWNQTSFPVRNDAATSRCKVTPLVREVQ